MMSIYSEPHTASLSEHYIQNQIREWCGNNNLLCFRCNVGRVLTADNIWFDTGLPSGFSDLLILDNNGHAIFCEVKSLTGKQRPDQKKFESVVTSRGFLYILAHSLNEFVTIYTKNHSNHS